MASPALNPLVSELDNLSPQAKQAIVGAHQGLVGQMQAPAQQPQQPQAQPAPVQHLQPPSQVPTLGPAPIDVSSNQQEYSRLTAPSTPGVHDHSQTGLPGTGQIHNPWARIPLQIADAVGSTFAPRLMTVLPGTQLHHNMLVGQQQSAIGEGENEANEEQKRGLEAAQTTNQDMQPELKAAQAENAAMKTAETNRHNTTTEDTNNLKVSTGLAAHGLRPTADGTGYELDPSTPVGQKTQAQNEYMDARRGLAEAQAELARSKNDPNSASYKLAQEKIDVEKSRIAQSGAALGLRELEYDANYYGTGKHGEALPGAPAGTDGGPIGLKTAGITKPTTAARGRGEQGQAIITAGENLKKDIAANRDLFGNIGSYWKQMTNGTPIADPRAAKIMSEIASYAALQPAMHGMRGGQVMHEFEKMVGGIPKNADALTAAIDGIGGTAGVMRDIGAVRTVAPGGGQQHQGPQVGAVEGGYRFKGGDPSKQTSWEKAQ